MTYGIAAPSGALGDGTFMTTKEDAARDAARLLAETWGTTPDETIPIDPIRIARRLGIRVFNSELEPSVSAGIVKEPGQDPRILLNREDSANRRRFSCAHELGHFVRRRENPDQYEYVDYRDALSSSGVDPEEIYANEFAACLLMPEAEVRRLQRKGFTDLTMALRFDVSREAMQWRLRNLRLA